MKNPKAVLILSLEKFPKETGFLGVADITKVWLLYVYKVTKRLSFFMRGAMAFKALHYLFFELLWLRVVCKFGVA
jgi:hypothetical protein